MKLFKTITLFLLFLTYNSSVFAAIPEDLMQKAKSGDPEAQFQVGIKSTTANSDTEETLFWFTKAAEQGHIQAQQGLGLLYSTSEIVAPDYKKAMHWFLKAAQQGSSDAQLSIGGLYAAGNGVDQNYTEALAWYLKAANQGHSEAQYRVAYIYSQGLGLKKADYDTAYLWFYKSAEQLHPFAAHMMALSTALGRGTSADSVEALKWAIIAVNLGHTESNTTIKQLLELVNQSQIDIANARSSKWIEHKRSEYGQ